MLKLAKYLKKSVGYIIVMILLLFLQANSELALPDYTSRIVNTGIQQKGIEDGVPEKMQESTLEDLKLFLDSEGQELVDAQYVLQDGVYVLKATISKEERAELEKVMVKAEMVLQMLRNPEMMGRMSQSEETPEDSEGSASAFAGAALPAGMDPLAALRILPAAAREKILSESMKKLDAMPEMLVSQSAVTFVQGEYEALGEDLGARQTSFLLRVGLQMLLIAFLAMIATVAATFLSARLAARTAHDLRNDVFRKVISFNSEEFNRFSTASLITRSTNDVQQVQMFLAMGLRMVLFAPIIGLGGVLRVIQTNVSMSWILGLAVAAILVLVLILFAVAMPKFTSLQTLIDRLNLVSREQLTGVMVTRAFSTEKHEEARFEKANWDLTKTNLFVNRCMTFMMPIMMMILNGITVLIVYNGARGVDSGSMQVGDMMAFIQYAMHIIMSFLMLCMMSIIIPRANVAAKRISEVLETDVQIHDPLQPKTPKADVKGVVEFDHVVFRYPDGGDPVLEDISFTANRGETVAFIGSTGSGKSSLVSLIPRFFDVTEGSVKVDGVDVRDMTKQDLCSRLGFVPQKNTLFSGTIDSNIRYGCPDATEEEVIVAAAIAQATEFINKKEDQYQTPIAQGGTNVSGGQKQRLSIARAIAKKPEILIFDDSFSALDFKTDVALRKALKESTKDTTTLIVAQRISTILHADQIIVLDEGKMVGKGTHKELLKTCEVYRQIATSQLSEEELTL